MKSVVWKKNISSAGNMTAREPGRLVSDYIVEREAFERSILTCDMYKIFRRGPNLKVVSYSLNNRAHYESVRKLIQDFRNYYPDWFVRIYHDHSIDEEFICEIECIKDEDAESDDMKDFVDFCNVESLPYDTSGKTWNASFMNGTDFCFH